MNIDTIKSHLSQFDNDEVEIFINYLNHLANEKKNGKYKNPWVQHRSDEYLAGCFKAVNKDGLAFDGRHITLQSTGVSFDFVAYKNKMLNIYPESLFDVQLVREGDKFSFSKVSGTVSYQHEIANPFGDSEIIGAYCVIKNKRGEFLTTLSRTEIDKHRKVARTDYIWANWFNEMVTKTIVKKACKTHFADMYQSMETLDNEQNDLEQPLGISIETKQAIEAIKTIEELNNYYKANNSANSGVMEDFTKACASRKETILKTQETPEMEAETNGDS